MTVGDLRRLRREFDRLIKGDSGEVKKQVVGPHLQEVVLDVCKGIAWKYPPGRYTGRRGADRWKRGDNPFTGDFYDLASEVVLKLLEEGQLEWILEQAETISDARGLIGLHVQRTLFKRVETDVIDNLRRRALALLAEDPFIPTTGTEHLGDETRYIVARHTMDRYTMGGAPDAEPWRAENRFAEAVRRVALIRPLESHAAQERNPRVYNDRGPRSLKACLLAMANVYTEGFTIKEFVKVLEYVLADYFASHLVPDKASDEDEDKDWTEEDWDTEGNAGMDGGLTGRAGVASLDPGDQVMLDELAKEAVAGLNEEGRHIACCKFNNMSDAKVGDLRGYSRATARERWQGVKEYLAGVLDDLEEPQALYVGKRIHSLLADGEEPEDG